MQAMLNSYSGVRHLSHWSDRRQRGPSRDGWLRGPGVLAEDAHLGLLVLPCRQHPDLFEAEMLAHFVAEVLGFHVPARSRREPDVRPELYHETPKDMEGSKAADAFQQFRRPMHAEQTKGLGGAVYRHNRRECPHADNCAAYRKPIVLPPRHRCDAYSGSDPYRH